jgi:hypothetical protein
MFTPEAMRARFHELKAQREAIKAVSDPIRAERDAHVQAARAKEDELTAALKAAEEGLFDLDMEMAALARALNGKTGSPE